MLPLMSRFPDILKDWRGTRRFSQLALAAEADVSLRHLSFLETGRSRPSPGMVERLCDALDMPLAARNQMLVAAGFAARHAARRWDDTDMAPVRHALEHTLESHAPYPAIAVDRLWTVSRLNAPARALFGPLGIDEGVSLLELMTSDALPPLIENWPEVARHATRRLRTESAAAGGVPELDRVADHLAAVPWPDERPLGPVVPTVHRVGPVRLSLFATIAQFGTPEDLTLENLKIELYFPADEATDVALRALAESVSRG